MAPTILARGSEVLHSARTAEGYLAQAITSAFRREGLKWSDVEPLVCRKPLVVAMPPSPDRTCHIHP